MTMTSVATGSTSSEGLRPRRHARRDEGHAGSQCSTSDANSITRPMATTNSGSDVTASAITDRVLSSQPSRRAAARIPRPTPTSVPIRPASSTSTSEFVMRGTDELTHRIAVGERLAQVSPQHAGDPIPVLHDHRPVEVQLGFERFHPLGCGVLPEHRVRGVAGQHRRGREDHDRDQEQREDAERQAAPHQLIMGGTPGRARVRARPPLWPLVLIPPSFHHRRVSSASSS